MYNVSYMIAYAEIVIVKVIILSGTVNVHLLVNFIRYYLEIWSFEYET